MDSPEGIRVKYRKKFKINVFSKITFFCFTNLCTVFGSPSWTLAVTTFTELERIIKKSGMGRHAKKKRNSVKITPPYWEYIFTHRLSVRIENHMFYSFHQKKRSILSLSIWLWAIHRPSKRACDLHKLGNAEQAHSFWISRQTSKT